MLDGHPQKFAPGERFAYNNGGFVVLALIAERAGGMPFPELVRTRVCEPAGMRDTEFLRSDEPRERVALGYLDGESLRTNVLHLPVRGSGDGGVYTTAADVHALWSALYAGRIVPADRLAEMVRPHSDVPSESMRYGLGFWLHPTGDAVILDGGDAGVSFRSVHDEATGVTHTVLSNTTEGAWPVTRRLVRAARRPERRRYRPAPGRGRPCRCGSRAGTTCTARRRRPRCRRPGKGSWPIGARAAGRASSAVTFMGIASVKEPNAVVLGVRPSVLRRRIPRQRAPGARDIGVPPWSVTGAAGARVPELAGRPGRGPARRGRGRPRRA